MDVAAWRFWVVLAGLSALAVLIIWRALSLQVLDVDRGYRFLQGQGDARTIRSEKIPAHRGMITDRNGEPLAVSTPVVSIFANPRELVKAEERWSELARVIEMPKAELAQKLQRYKQSQFMYLRRHLAPADAEKVLALKIPGVHLQHEYRRFYPAGEVAAHLVGFTNIDDHGQEGLELAYDDWLSGEAGSKTVLKDLYGNTIRDVDPGEAASPGKDLRLSIDLRLQYLAYRELKSALKRTGAKAGSLVILDSDSGEVLALVNQPSFNPNNRRMLSLDALRNRAIIDMFEPGSTMKPLTMVAALESGRYTSETKIDTSPGYIRVGPKVLRDHRDYGVLSIAEILQKSSQVGTTKIALSLEEDGVWQVFQRFGLGRSTGSGFPGESTGVLNNHQSWHPIERATLAFGYGMTVTNLQLAQAYSVFANDGVLKPVSLLARAQTGQRVEPNKGQQIVDANIAHQVLGMLETVTQSGGTATRAQVEAYRVAGKTGTSHKAEAGGYAEDRYVSVFAGVAPVSNPRVVAVVAIDEPQGDYYGGLVAAPVFSQVVGDALRLLDVRPDDLGERTETKNTKTASRAESKEPTSPGGAA
ncbi:penicillin-binding protein 2 [Spongiibacter sp. KMU-158]|uniref:Peptidoglycan D,D-transpeptidase FtsI n=1 Tax=Spongiibacter pelagi TaxID=2760804 RepID=A0A927C2T2_9GAMM|nr:penicillin-binding transpeptidase domain-containing protein [Spongiibacter pelagi]MBD2859734.1 penicillin-binding protein 2 [Spongiibacter pelagi]